MSLPPAAEGSAEVAARVARARDLQSARARDGGDGASPLNAGSSDAWLDMITSRTLRLARTAADLEGAEGRHAFTLLPWDPPPGARRGGGQSCSRSAGR